MRRPGAALSIVGACAALLFCTSALATGAAVPRWNHWLCFPGSPTDWCNVVLKTIVVGQSGTAQGRVVPVAADPQVDCFYVYPTVSEQERGNSTLTVEPQERTVAIVQAAEFSRVCRVYAPMYEQTTARAGTCATGGSVCIPEGSRALAYGDVLAAWNDYLAYDNHGRGVILIGHSQGSSLLEQLIEQQIDRSPAERRLLVSAILLGDVTVRDGSTSGGSFADIPACTSANESGCVVSYSAWGRTPPSDAIEQGVANSSEHVLCVNPAAPGSTRAVAITPIFIGQVPEGIVPFPSAYDRDLFVVFPDLYTARCVRQGTRAWLLIRRIHHAGDTRPTVEPILGPSFGLHAADVNIALANLVALVATQERSWLTHH